MAVPEWLLSFTASVRTERGIGHELADFDVAASSRGATFVMSTCEGPRFVPGDVESSDALLADLDELMA